MAAVAPSGETSMNTRARKRTALMARRFASVWLLWSSSRDAEPSNLNRLICLEYLRALRPCQYSWGENLMYTSFALTFRAKHASLGCRAECLGSAHFGGRRQIANQIGGRGSRHRAHPIGLDIDCQCLLDQGHPDQYPIQFCPADQNALETRQRS